MEAVKHQWDPLQSPSFRPRGDFEHRGGQYLMMQEGRRGSKLPEGGGEVYCAALQGWHAPTVNEGDWDRLKVQNNEVNKPQRTEHRKRTFASTQPPGMQGLVGQHPWMGQRPALRWGSAKEGQRRGQEVSS